MAEIYIMIFSVALTAALMVPVVRYARRQTAEAERLQRMGWTCVGVDFLTGPIMVPPREPTP